MINYRYFALACLMIASTAALNAKDGHYSGSQAYNKPQLMQESINAATGTLDIAYPLIKACGYLSTFQLTLNYRFNKQGMFGLPKGWQLDLDYIADKSAHLHNQQWLIDPLWHDETGFSSGLKYYNLHGTQFIDEGIAKEIPNHKDIFYRYYAKLKDGSIKFFSHQGLLVLQKDRFNNTLLFDYEKPIRTLETARLKSITDNYGNIYRFGYAPNEIILQYPDNRISHIYFHDTGVIKIMNPLNQSTTFEYIQRNEYDLLNKIETPRGLLTQVSYDEINYKYESTTKKMPVVSQVKKLDKSSNKTLRETHYTYSKDNNFTGYPDYSLAESGDSLMDSNNRAYRYSVQITQSDAKKTVPTLHTQVFYYNYLHLPIEIHTLKQGKQYLKTTYDYTIAPFKTSRSTNYDKPSTVTSYIWDDAHGIFIPTSKITHDYDHYGNPLEEHHARYDRTYSRWINISSKCYKYFTNDFSLLAESTLSDLLTGEKTQIKYTLSNNRKTYKNKTTYSTKEEFEKFFKPWKTYSYNHDNHGRLLDKSIAWSVKNKPGIQKTTVTKSYLFNKENKQLSISKKSALGNTLTHLMDTRNGNKIMTIDPEGNHWQFGYDFIGRIIRFTDPLGHVTHKTYGDYQTNSANTMTEKSPLNYAKRTNYDALNQIAIQEDFHDSCWRTLSTYTYNGWGKVIEKKNHIGLPFIIEYDDLQRPIRFIDPWNNQRTVNYNDLQLTTTTYYNGNKATEQISLPWTLTTHLRSFPVFDNPHDPQMHFVEETTKKNALGLITEKEKALIHRYTQEKTENTTAHFTYDISHNLTQKTMRGFDGIQQHQTTRYDLFNNKFSHKKSMTANNETHNHQGEKFFIMTTTYSSA